MWRNLTESSAAGPRHLVRRVRPSDGQTLSREIGSDRQPVSSCMSMYSYEVEVAVHIAGKAQLGVPHGGATSYGTAALLRQRVLGTLSEPVTVLLRSSFTALTVDPLSRAERELCHAVGHRQFLWVTATRNPRHLDSRPEKVLWQRCWAVCPGPSCRDSSPPATCQPGV